MCCAMLSTAAFADISDIRKSNNQISMRVISTNVDYTETGNGLYGTSTGILDTESGPVGGYALTLALMRDLLLGNDYFEFGNDYSSGHTSYTGSYQGGTYGSVVTTSTAILGNFSARYGSGTMVNAKIMLTPYAEFGHHEWNRGVNYGEIYTHNYFGLGVLAQYSPEKKWVLSANALLGKTFGSYIVVVSGPGLTGFEGSLGDSALYRAGLSADYALDKNLHGSVGIDFTSFSYGISAAYPVGGGIVAWEPDSKTNYTTFKIGLGYAF